MSASKVHLTVNQKFKIKLITPWSRVIIGNMKLARLSGIVKIEESEKYIYEGWNFNSGNYLFTTDTK